MFYVRFILTCFVQVRKNLLQVHFIRIRNISEFLLIYDFPMRQNQTNQSYHLLFQRAALH
jgi:hypothetical protein